LALAGMAAMLFMIAWGLYRTHGIKLDFANFYDAGTKARAGAFDVLYDPHALIDGEPSFGAMSFVSAPISAWLYAPISLLPPYTALFVFKALGAAAIMAGLVLLWRHLRRLAGPSPADRDAFLALFAVAAAVFQPFWTIFRVGGQTTPLIFLLLVVTLIALDRARPGLAAFWIAAAVLIKPVVGPAAFVLFLGAGSRFRLAALAFGIGSAAVSVALLGLDVHLAFLDAISDKSGGLMVPWYNAAPFAFVEPLMLGAKAYAKMPVIAPDTVIYAGLVLRGLMAVALALGLVALMRRVPSPRAQAAALLHGATIIMLTVSPILWAHYLCWLFPLIVTLIALGRHLSGMAKALLAAAVASGFFLNEIVIDRLVRLTGLDSLAEITAFSVVRGLPMLLLFLLFAVARRDILAALRDPAWD
jgi:hypothetical protein